MPRTRSLAWAELKIGIIAVVAIAARRHPHRRRRRRRRVLRGSATRSKTQFPDVKGLKSGAVVRVAGVEVGKVTERGADRGRSRSGAAKCKKGNEQRITTESRASIGSLSLLGEPVIDISPVDDGHAAQGRRHRAGRPAPGQLADVAEGGHESLEQMTAILQDIRGGQGHHRQALHRRRALQGDHRASSRPPKGVAVGTCARAAARSARSSRTRSPTNAPQRVAREPAGDDRGASTPARAASAGC